jgi:hypothetical protein
LYIEDRGRFRRQLAYRIVSPAFDAMPEVPGAGAVQASRVSAVLSVPAAPTVALTTLSSPGIRSVYASALAAGGAAAFEQVQPIDNVGSKRARSGLPSSSQTHVGAASEQSGTLGLLGSSRKKGRHG